MIIEVTEAIGENDVCVKGTFSVYRKKKTQHRDSIANFSSSARKSTCSRAAEEKKKTRTRTHTQEK